jgi:hypothetical protein
VGPGLGADQAAGAGLVVDHHLLAPQLGQLVAEEPREQVTAAAGRVGHDEMHRLVWEVLRLRALERRKPKEQGERCENLAHGVVWAHAFAGIGHAGPSLLLTGRA